MHTTTTPASIQTHNDQLLQSTHVALLKDKYLPLKSREAHILSGLSKALIPIGILCENGCIAFFDDASVAIINKKYGKTLVCGGRYNRLYLFILELQAPDLMTNTTSPKTLSTTKVCKCKSKFQFIDYHHVSC